MEIIFSAQSEKFSAATAPQNEITYTPMIVFIENTKEKAKGNTEENNKKTPMIHKNRTHLPNKKYQERCLLA